MPYYRKPSYRKRTYRKRSYKPRTRWQNYKVGLQQLAKDVQSVKNMVNVEYKNHDVEQTTAVNSNTSGSIYELNWVNQGDGTETRDGSMFRMKSLELRYLLSNTGTSNIVARVMIICNTDGSEPSLGGILDQTTQPVISPRNLDNRSRYICLYDKLHSLSPSGQDTLARKVFKPLDMKVLITGATASTSNVEKNGLYLVIMADTTGSNHRFQSRIRYIDN